MSTVFRTREEIDESQKQLPWDWREEGPWRKRMEEGTTAVSTSL